MTEEGKNVRLVVPLVLRPFPEKELLEAVDAALPTNPAASHATVSMS